MLPTAHGRLAQNLAGSFRTAAQRGKWLVVPHQQPRVPTSVLRPVRPANKGGRKALLMALVGVACSATHRSARIAT